MITKEKLQEDLQAFTKGKPYSQHNSGLTLSEGVHSLQLKTGDWLINAIANYQKSDDKLSGQGRKVYQLWELSTATYTRAILRGYRDHKDITPIIEEFINPHQFPLAKIKLYFVAGVLMLSSELFDDP